MSLKKRNAKEKEHEHSAGSGAPVMLTKEPSTTLLVDEKKDAKWKGWWQRFWTTWAMLGGFIIIVYMGHPALVAFVFFLQTMMFKEIKRLASVLSKDQDKPPVRPLQWYWFFTAIFFTYGQVMKQYFGVAIPYHSFLSFGMYAMGIVTFVLSLRKNHFRYQFEVFAWVHLALLIVVVQSTFLIVNMFQGLIWFILPALLIVSNDTWAYFFGFFFGRTPLIAISPKKTWEGFSGAAVMTLLTGFLLARFLSQFEFLVCPQTSFTFGQPHCKISDVYIGVPHALPPYALQIVHALGLNWDYILISPMQQHGLVLALFSSFIAPFGGFFASGFKRAFDIKDFGASIPGHGGVTDRMDCQIMMGLFAFVYYSNFVRSPAVSAAAILHTFHLLPVADQKLVYQQIQQTLQQAQLI